MTNFRVQGAREIQEAKFFRAIARSFYDRGNRKTEISFDTTRLFGSQVDAEKFLLEHETQFPGQALVAFTAGLSGSSATVTRYLKNAVVESVNSGISGCTTKHSYRISGGVMQTSPN